MALVVICKLVLEIIFFEELIGLSKQLLKTQANISFLLVQRKSLEVYVEIII